MPTLTRQICLWSARCVLAAATLLPGVLRAAPGQAGPYLRVEGRVAAGADAATSQPFTGTGRFKFALVDGLGTRTIWSNDGTSVSGGPPTGTVTLPVTGGFYAVSLGDPTLPSMSTLPLALLVNEQPSFVFLRTWFDDGSHGFQQLKPDRRLAAVAYTFSAQDVADGLVKADTLAAGAVDTRALAAGTLETRHFAPGVVTTALAGVNLTLPLGGILFAESPAGAAALEAAKLTPLGRQYLQQESWQELIPPDSPAARTLHSSVWTGSEMIIWGGRGPGTVSTATRFAEGARYNPATNTWTALPGSGLSARERHTATWTGTEMIIWGGESYTGGTLTAVNSGARYNPATDSWTALPSASAPSARSRHTAVWSGTDLIIWGGRPGSSSQTPVATGARFTPSSNAWTALPATGAPAARSEHAACWTGTEMAILGGIGTVDYERNITCFSPSTATWRSIDPFGFSTISQLPTQCAWTGQQILIWTGTTVLGYAPGSDTWAPPDSPPGPAPTSVTSTWTGTEWILTGAGADGEASSWRYDPAASVWGPVAVAPGLRYGPSAVWSGSRLLVWGGGANGANTTPAPANSVWSCQPPSGLVWLLQRRR